ncbi:hypothetical protein HMPREF1218_2151 [Hoylesella pleuritidis F0068]|uniref:Uncharacterized protein n=2 Tax=Hoylesella pleuritidis TaxID=407975 RepID=U2MNI8_9BACT|nr:hypothetical protein HMPREF1218_2151 [Hoylesella pleuritidis F0068]
MRLWQMKTTDIIRRLCLFFFALMRVEPAAVENASGNEYCFNIATKADGKTFCNRVNGREGGHHGKCRQPYST